MSALVNVYNRLSIPVLRAGHLRFACLLVAIAVYAVFGSPTPDTPGMVEMVVGGLLVLAVGMPGAWQAIVSSFSKAPFWDQAGRALLLFGITVPVLVGVAAGAMPADILRDVLPFLFFLLPVFLFVHLDGWTDKAPLLLFAIVAAGVIFSARAIGNSLSLLLLQPYAPELFYFANAPTVLLSALVIIGWAGNMMLRAGHFSDIMKSAGVMLIVVLPIVAMAMAVQRASLGAVAIYIAVLAVAGFVRAPARAVLPLVMLGIVGWAAYPLIADTASLLFQKTLDVGVNMRTQEIMAVWNEVSGSPLSLLFGLGWGAEFHSPAVGGFAVGYTHNLVTYMLLKTGLCGVGLAALYVAGLMDALMRLFNYRPALAMALAAPFLIDIFLYASFKSFDFGLVLLLIPVYLLACRKTELSRP